MAAYAALLSLRWILQQLMDPDRSVLHEKQQIESLQEKVSFLVDFVENYSVYTHKVVKDLEIKIRDAAYEAEDIIMSYISTSILSQLDGGDSMEGLQTFWQDLNRIIKETHSIQQEGMDIKRMLKPNYMLQRKTLLVDRSRLTFTDTTAPMVGLDEDKDKIKDWLTSSLSKREVISIVGMGGIGKTTLAQKLFDDSLIVCKFDVRAWVTVSQECQIREIFTGLLDSTNELSPEMRKVGGGELADRLYKSLKGRKYIIVMDDVWDTKVWDEVKRIFPDDHNGSRIVLTTRLKNVGDHAATFDHLHNMNLLSPIERTPPMVGLDEDKDKIMDWLTSSSSKLEVISIVGTGGNGKTTLAQKLFDDSLVVFKFDVRGWVTVSQEYQMSEIFAGLLDSTNELSPEMRKLSDGELADRAYKSLKGRKYIIVMDDVWETKVWDEVKGIFPDDHNGSRIVLTTRLKDAGEHAASFDRLHDMNLLSPSESWNLFCETVFRGECCPLSLMDMGRQIVKKCEGLPLSIVVIGGLLSIDKTVSFWKTIANVFKSVLATDGGQCSTIFSLSYNHLPPHLKPCFLYFALFPEDYVIGRSKLIKLWIAEGFIKPNESKSLEDIAKECLEDLSNRSLIMVLELGREGKVKTYKIHDLLRDFCITEAQKEKFLYVTNRYTTPSNPEGIRSEGCMFIQRFTPFKSSSSNSSGPPLPTRSILLYDSNADIIISDHRFGRLRVLDMGSGKTFCEFPMEVVRLVHLRYLSLWLGTAYFFEAIVPASISLIRGLQTLVLDMEDYIYDLHLPQEVWTMTHLRHVQIRSGVRLLDPPNSGVEGKNFVILANLQTLSMIRNFRFTDEIIKRIPKLKKLKVSYDDLGTGDWSQFHLSNIMCLNELESLHIDCHIYPYYKIASPQYIKFPATLKKLTLSGWRLRWEDLTMVGSLPNLEVLKLCDKACKGQVWEPNEGEFRELKLLELDYLDLIHWRADDSHFPKLKYLRISRCSSLKEIPIEIGDIPSLEMIELDYACPSELFARPSAVYSARQILFEQRNLGNDVLQVRIKAFRGR